ncbi:MAG: cytochrome c oxidase subunit 3 [Bryobacterales bacterium]|nr:cytochrome c oxidase subunit 3 [Bryobacterales bacterium]
MTTLWAVRLFVASDAFTFAALLLGYAYLRAHSGSWPAPFTLLPGLLLTAILLASSFSMAKAVRSPKAAKPWLLATLVCGVAFLVLHSLEWRHLIAERQVGLHDNPWGVPLFGATFFTLTGLHMAHVAAGVAVIGGLLRGSSLQALRAANLYWQFVDGVWLFLFPAVYLTALQS